MVAYDNSKTKERSGQVIHKSGSSRLRGPSLTGAVAYKSLKLQSLSDILVGFTILIVTRAGRLQESVARKASTVLVITQYDPTLPSLKKILNGK